MRDDDQLLASRFERAGAWAVPPVPWAEAADDRVTAEQLAKKVRECLAGLPPGQREVVLLHDVEALPAVEVCSVLGINEGIVGYCYTGDGPRCAECSKPRWWVSRHAVLR